MRIEPGTRLGLYEIVAAVGAGGMGEVYRARDTRLDRTVAIKVLPALFVSDPDRLARFEREAKTLASLNHPNIAQIYGAEQISGVHALAMEFVDGEDLSQRLTRGRVPIVDALPIARQIAEALEAAHERGIIHRDLKPANVKVRDDGTVKVLDFGLAKAASPAAAGAAALAQSPTFTSPAVTQMGVILGTAAYMSPEQAKGKPVDRAADMWAFGALLFELLAGTPAFGGETVTDVLAAIVTREPEWRALPPDTPASIRRLMGRCLERDRRRRLADAGEARFQIEEAMGAPAAAVDVVPAPRTRRGSAAIPWAIAAAFAIVAAVLAIVAWRRPEPPLSRYAIEIPPKVTMALSSRPAVAISPDGRTIAFVGSFEGVDRLMVRRADSFEAQPLVGTEGATHPVFSPDGGSIAFATNARLMRVPVAGGTPVPLADVTDPRGLSWDEDGTIVLTPTFAGPVYRVPSTGGSPVAVTKLASADERSHRWPQILPGGGVMFTIGTFANPDSYDDASIVVQMPDGRRRPVVTAAMARYVATGHLLHIRNGTLFAVPFDPYRVEVKGTAVSLLQDVAADATTGAGHFAASRAGTLIYVGGGSSTARLPTWLDTLGRAEPLRLNPSAFTDVRISPDGQRMAVSLVAGGGRDIWVHNFQRRTFTRMTFGGQNLTPLWSRDGALLYYLQADPAGGGGRIMRRAADGSGDEERIVNLPARGYLNDLSLDGRSAIVNLVTPGEGYSIAVVDLAKDAKPVPLIAGRAQPYSARLSPDGRWLAYTSPESGRPEIYVRPFGGGSGRWQVSAAGGEEPVWSRDGRRLFFRYGTLMMSTDVKPGPAFEWTPPTQVLNGVYDLRIESGITYDVNDKGDRFLMIRLANENAGLQALRLVVNWMQELR